MVEQNHLGLALVAKGQHRFLTSNIDYNASTVLLVLHKQALDSVLLDEHIDTCLSDTHDDSVDEAVLKGLLLEIKERVILNARLRSKHRHSVLAVHLVALLGELELVSHVVGEGSNVNCSC